MDNLVGDLEPVCHSSPIHDPEDVNDILAMS